MSDIWLLSEAQMRRIEPYFPLSHGIPRVDDRRIVSGIIFVIRKGLRWRDAPADYDPHKPVLSLSKETGVAYKPVTTAAPTPSSPPSASPQPSSSGSGQRDGVVAALPDGIAMCQDSGVESH